MSPFTVRAVNKTIINLNPTTFKEKNEPEDKNTNNKTEISPSWTIEGITQRNLDPSITPAEQKEYERYQKKKKLYVHCFG